MKEAFKDTDNLRLLPLAVVGLAVGLVDVCVVQEVHRFKERHPDLGRDVGRFVTRMAAGAIGAYMPEDPK